MDRQRKKKIGRNDPCHCGSGKKFKHCHGSLTTDSAELPKVSHPRVSSGPNRQRTVVVGDRTYHGTWGTFFNFLDFYIQEVFGADWIKLESEKPLGERHPLLDWSETVHRYLNSKDTNPGKTFTTLMNGAASAYFGLAYNLYLLAATASLQKKMLGKLKVPREFHGAYYETLVGAWLILAGFEVTPEDHSDLKKHCDFTAHSKITNRSYSVEAKAREPDKANLDVGNQLYKALRKTAKHERIVMIDTNVPHDPSRNRYELLSEVLRGIEGREATLKVNRVPAPPAYVLVTNHPYHFDLDGISTVITVLADGFKIPDFGGKTIPSLIHFFRERQKYADLYKLIRAIEDYAIPSTFLGEITDLAFASERDWKIGGQYDLSELKIDGRGSLLAVAVSEDIRMTHLNFQLADGLIIHAMAPMSDDQLAKFHANPKFFLGAPFNIMRSPMEQFDFLYASNLNTSREQLLVFLTCCPDSGDLLNLNDHDLLLQYCDRAARGVIAV